MAMPEDLVGRYIEYKIDMGGGGGTTDYGQVLTTEIDRASVVVYNTGLVRIGAPWVFYYLKYVPGAVTVAPLQGRPVMTGPLSGCYIFRYTQNGSKLAHVGTAHTPTDAGTLAAKTAWGGVMADRAVNNVTGSSPFHCFTTVDFGNAMIKGGQAPIIVGYYTDAASYAMLLSKVPTANLPLAYNGRALLRVSSVKQMTLQSWATIRRGPKFAGTAPPIPSRAGRSPLVPSRMGRRTLHH
jgi:hypothetical protein